MRALAIRVTRDRPLPDRTLGTVELDLPDDAAGWLPFGYSCEPGDPIEPGTYAVHLYDSPAHGPDTPELVGVPHHQHIQIHSGNGPQDTLGCLLFGLGRDERQVLRSRLACTWLRREIAEVIRGGGAVTVEVRDAA